MGKVYTLIGDPKEIDKIIRENRIRINRGVIRFIPVDTESKEENHIDSPEDCDNGNNSGENIPELPENAVNENVTENAEQMDGKTIEVEDLKEFDIDADDKTIEVEDLKEVQVSDTKKIETVKKTSKRSKKTE